MIQVCCFDKKRDLQEHVPSLATDLNAAIETGVVHDTGVVSDYNDLSDLRSIRGRVGDVFEAIDAQNEILRSGRIVQKSCDSDFSSSSSSSSSDVSSELGNNS